MLPADLVYNPCSGMPFRTTWLGNRVVETVWAFQNATSTGDGILACLILSPLSAGAPSAFWAWWILSQPHLRLSSNALVVCLPGRSCAYHTAVVYVTSLSNGPNGTQRQQRYDRMSIHCDDAIGATRNNKHAFEVRDARPLR